LLLCIFASCSDIAFDKDYEKIMAGKDGSNISKDWYRTSPKPYMAFEHNGDISTHYFFDPDPEINVPEAEINFIPVTIEGSSIMYNLDTLSGKIYAHRPYCEQKDIFKSYKREIFKPPFTIGVIPRMMDQLGQKQEIFVFGNKNYYRNRRHINQEKIRVIGGIIEQICPSGVCMREKDWLSHLLLIGVDPRDEDFMYTFNFEELKKKVDWKYVKAFIHNGRGKNNIAGKIVPAYRLRGELRADQAMLHMRSHGHFFHTEELTKMKTNCHKLYDHVWKTLGSRNLNEDFHKYFKVFTWKFSKQYQICIEYVRFSNINQDHERHWFFTYLTAFMKLYNMGYYFNCDNGNWALNPTDYRGKAVYSLDKEMRNCKPRMLDEGFKRAITFMRDMQRFGREYARYITYDNINYGTHQKVYSFVNVSARVLDCVEKKSEVTYEIFPDDVYWDLLPQSRKYNRIYGKLKK
jgi:hypothetical protein